VMVFEGELERKTFVVKLFNRFSDVSMLGYGLSSGRLNLDSTKFVASKLAKFHAASLYLDREVVSRVGAKIRR
jgi:hypothetical protein